VVRLYSVSSPLRRPHPGFGVGWSTLRGSGAAHMMAAFITACYLGPSLHKDSRAVPAVRRSFADILMESMLCALAAQGRSTMGTIVSITVFPSRTFKLNHRCIF
jgi:hypothetical protein